MDYIIKNITFQSNRRCAFIRGVFTNEERLKFCSCKVTVIYFSFVELNRYAREPSITIKNVINYKNVDTFIMVVSLNEGVNIISL